MMGKGVRENGEVCLVLFRDAAKRLACSVRTLERRIAAGLMPEPVYNGRKRVYPSSVVDQTVERITRGGKWAE